jgi:hypothetical protein
MKVQKTKRSSRLQEIIEECFKFKKNIKDLFDV